MKQKFDIFISYKRKSLPTANNLYYRLTTRGYSVFFDLEEMGRDNFNVQLLKYIEESNDVFVILEEGSLDACYNNKWEEDWFCREIAYALEKKKNIIPILLGNYKMPSPNTLPDKLKELSLKNAPQFDFSFFDEYIDKLVRKNYLLSQPQRQEKVISVFKFYSNEDCYVFKEGKQVCCLIGMSEEPFYFPVSHKGDYRFKATNMVTNASITKDETIGEGEEKKVEIKWGHGFKLPSLSAQRKKIISIVVSAILLLSLLTIIFLEGFPLLRNQGFVPSFAGNVSLTQCAAVDLGLPSRTLWSDRNVGAKSLSDFGAYYAWGAIKPIENGKAEIPSDSPIPANISRTSSICRTSYDVASIESNGYWAMPTREQFEELIELCTWTWGMVKGVVGYTVKGPNGKEIFLPAAGCIFNEGSKYTSQFGYYWTGDCVETSYPVAKELIIGFNEINIENGRKYVGRSIRPVTSLLD